MSATIICDPATFQWAGVFGLSLVSRRRRKSPLNGFGYEYTFKGLPESVNAAFLTLAADQEGQTEEQGPIHYITIFTADNPESETSNVISSSFELHGNNLQDDILSHRYIQRLQPVTIARLSDVVSKALGGTYSDAAAVSAAAVAAAAAEQSNPALREFAQTTFFNSWLKRRGNLAFHQAQYVFRATLIISRRGVIPALFANPSKIYTAAQMKTETGPTPRYVEAIDAVNSTAPSPASTGYTWGWLKQAATLTNVAGNREGVQVEYWLAEWESWIYDSL